MGEHQTQGRLPGRRVTGDPLTPCAQTPWLSRTSPANSPLCPLRRRSSLPPPSPRVTPRRISPFFTNSPPKLGFFLCPFNCRFNRIDVSMSDLAQVLHSAQAGDMTAYDEIVSRFQDMAVGYAFSVLGDFHLAEDAAQEAFVEAYPILDRVYGPGALGLCPGGCAAWSSSIATACFVVCESIRSRCRMGIISPGLRAIRSRSSRRRTPDAVSCGRSRRWTPRSGRPLRCSTWASKPTGRSLSSWDCHAPP